MRVFLTCTGFGQVLLDFIKLESMVAQRLNPLAHLIIGGTFCHLIDEFFVLGDNTLKYEVSLDADSRQNLALQFEELANCRLYF